MCGFVSQLFVIRLTGSDARLARRYVAAGLTLVYAPPLRNAHFCGQGIRYVALAFIDL